MKKSFLFLIMLYSAISFSQSLNDYKYAIVPAKFSFQNEADQYKLNTYTKMFLQKYGFEVFFDTDSIPQQVANSNCNKVYVDLVESSSMLVSKLTVVVKDCTNKILFKSAEGQSHEKDYKTAYVQALRKAFESFDALHHQYNGNEVKDVVVEKKDAEPVDVKAVKPVSQEQPLLLIFEKDSEVSATPTKNGYDLIYSTGNHVGSKIMELLKTSKKNCYIAVMPDRQGVLLLEDNEWKFEYYTAGKMVSQQLRIGNLQVQ